MKIEVDAEIEQGHSWDGGVAAQPTSTLASMLTQPSRALAHSPEQVSASE